MVELLVVFVIILVLMALLLGAVNRIFVTLDETRTVADINQLSQACEAFKLRYGRYPPSLIRLRERGGYNPMDLLDEFSVQYLTSVFPGIDLDLWTTSGNTVWHDWDGDGTSSNADFVLSGNECLVFFLGGQPIATSAGIQLMGFNTDKALPVVYPSPARDGPFFEFRPERLVATNANPRFRSYSDPYGTPYLYYAAGWANQNNYNTLPHPQAPPNTSNDCYPLLVNLSAPPGVPPPNSVPFSPYIQSTNTVGAEVMTTFHRPDKFQIISAGRDRFFGFRNSTVGLTGQYTAGQENPTVSVFDRDNLTNFSEGVLVPK
jgi:type II secretory pathway pseudopilin PulG